MSVQLDDSPATILRVTAVLGALGAVLAFALGGRGGFTSYVKLLVPAVVLLAIMMIARKNSN